MKTPLRSSVTIDTDLSADRLFVYLHDWTHVAEWDPAVMAVHRRASADPVAEPCFGVVRRRGWRHVAGTATITRALAPHRLTLEERSGRFVLRRRFRLTGGPTGTRLRVNVEITAADRPRPVDAIVIRRLRRTADVALCRLARLLCGSRRPPVLTPLTDLADRSILFGMVGFTRLGFAMGRRRRPVAGARYADRVMVLTGGTSGIGRVAAGELYRRGVRLVVVGRDAAKLADLCRELKGSRGSGRVETEVADLSRLDEIRLLAARLRRRTGSIDVLINNAGALFNRYRQTAEGIEMTMATDLVGPYLLTRLLLPSLAAAGSARIVNVASGGMYTQAMSAGRLLVDPADYDGPTVYARAKRGLVMLSQWWARELAPSGISVHAMHPGWVDTPGLAASLPTFHRYLSPWLRSPVQGADTIVWLAAAPDAARASGRFWLDRKIRATHVFGHTRSSEGAHRRLVRALDALCTPDSTG